jgi:hypothetical protein
VLSWTSWRSCCAWRGATAGLHDDPLGPAMISFRDPDNFQWEFFEEL